MKAYLKFNTHEYSEVLLDYILDNSFFLKLHIFLTTCVFRGILSGFVCMALQ